MIDNKWRIWNVSLGVEAPPEDVLIKAYAYYDLEGLEFVGTRKEIIIDINKRVNQVRNNQWLDACTTESLWYYGLNDFRNSRSDLICWKFTGIGLEQMDK